VLSKYAFKVSVLLCFLIHFAAVFTESFSDQEMLASVLPCILSGISSIMSVYHTVGQTYCTNKKYIEVMAWFRSFSHKRHCIQTV